MAANHTATRAVILADGSLISQQTVFPPSQLSETLITTTGNPRDSPLDGFVLSIHHDSIIEARDRGIPPA